jgi:hypothetical protein
MKMFQAMQYGVSAGFVAALHDNVCTLYSLVNTGFVAALHDNVCTLYSVVNTGFVAALHGNVCTLQLGLVLYVIAAGLCGEIQNMCLFY